MGRQHMWWIIPYFLGLWGISWLISTALSGTGILGFSRHGGSGRFDPADILCGHSSGDGGQHHESPQASLWQTRFQRTVNKAFFAVAAVVRA